MYSKTALWVLAAGLALAGEIDRDGVRNWASAIPEGLPGGGVAPGSVVAVHGRGFAPGGGVRLLIGSAGRTWTVPAEFQNPTLLRAVLPPDLTPGYGFVQVVGGGPPGNRVAVRVEPFAFGIFTDDDAGMGAAVAETVERGKTVTLRGTGLGGPGAAPRMEVFIGSRAARVVAVERGAGGTDWVRFVVPADAPRGCHVPVMVRVNGVQPSNWASLRIEPDPGVCEQTARARSAMKDGGSAGFVVPLHLSMRYQSEPKDSVDFTGDALIAGFRQGSDGAGVGRVLAAPEPGTCRVYRQSIDAAQVGAQLNATVLGGTRRLTAGEMELRAGGETRRVKEPAADRDVYYQTIGGDMPDMTAGLPLFLRPGKLWVKTAGSADVAAMEFDVTMPEPVRWSGRNRVAAVDRGKPLDIEWNVKNHSQPIAIAGVQIDKPTRAAAAFLCLPEPKSTHFRVPAEVLGALPPSRTQFDQSLGFLFVATLAGLDVTRFNEGSLDALLAAGLAVDGRSVQFH